MLRAHHRVIRFPLVRPVLSCRSSLPAPPYRAPGAAALPCASSSWSPASLRAICVPLCFGRFTGPMPASLHSYSPAAARVSTAAPISIASRLAPARVYPALDRSIYGLKAPYLRRLLLRLRVSS